MWTARVTAHNCPNDVCQGNMNSLKAFLKLLQVIHSFFKNFTAVLVIHEHVERFARWRE